MKSNLWASVVYQKWVMWMKNPELDDYQVPLVHRSGMKRTKTLEIHEVRLP